MRKPEKDFLFLLAALAAAAPAIGLRGTQQQALSHRTHRRMATPHMREVRVNELPPRPPMAPATVVVEALPPGAEELESAMMQAQATPPFEVVGVDGTPEGVVVPTTVHKPVEEDVVVMERLKNLEDTDGGLANMLGGFFNLLDPSGVVRKRLWTRADFMHIHAVTGGYFLFLGIPWLLYSHLTNYLDPSVPMQTSSAFLSSLLVAGLVNALSAIPMSRFSSNQLFDLKDLKANGFTFGGTGLTVMCLYIAWWFSGDYPEALHAFDVPIFFFWALVCVGTTVNWEVMLQQNFEDNERKQRAAEASGQTLMVSQNKQERDQKALLYRLASWPNLTQLLFMYSIPFGGLAWLHGCEASWPMQNTPMYHYGIASAMGYALSMFSETLRDRKLVSLETDFAILVIGFCFPMVSVALDALTYGSAVTINPLDYWVILGHAPAP